LTKARIETSKTKDYNRVDVHIDDNQYGFTVITNPDYDTIEAAVEHLVDMILDRKFGFTRFDLIKAVLAVVHGEDK
jgi:hypothetical protein